MFAVLFHRGRWSLEVVGALAIGVLAVIIALGIQRVTLSNWTQSLPNYPALPYRWSLGLMTVA